MRHVSGLRRVSRIRAKSNTGRTLRKRKREGDAMDFRFADVGGKDCVIESLNHRVNNLKYENVARIKDEINIIKFIYVNNIISIVRIM